MKIVSDNDFKKKITGLDFDNLDESDMLDAFVFLNLDSLNTDFLKKTSMDMYKLVLWCQAAVSYHILIHPYTCRNIKSKFFIFLLFYSHSKRH